MDGLTSRSLMNGAFRATLATALALAIAVMAGESAHAADKAAIAAARGDREILAAYSPPAAAGMAENLTEPRAKSEPSAAVPTAYVAVAIARLVSTSGDGAAGVDPEERALLRSFYLQRGFTPAWVDGSGLHGRAGILLAVLASAADDGLDPDDYLPANLPDMTAGTPSANAADLGALDVGLSAALLRYARHLRLGRLDPERLDPDGVLVRKTFDAATALANAAAADDLGGHLFALIPANPSYAGLRRSLLDYRTRAAAGGWPTPAPDRLEPGSEGEAVVLLRRILRATGDLREDPAATAAPAVYDEAVTLAVKSFQARHGLDEDGIVGEQTREVMAVPVEARIRQILLNMERVRWLPDDLGDPHVLVNIAGFTLSYVEAGAPPFEMRAIVGKPGRSSPEFSGLITYLELNPTWTVPRTIANEDLLPRIRRDPKFLTANGFTLFTQSGSVVDAAAVDWSGGSFPYWLRQKPGPRNALGRIKFMFPNSFDVYLHDTPSRGLFSQSVRALSSGCIRVEKPFELAAKLLEGNGDWDRKRLQGVVAGGSTRTVTLSRPVPVHLAYLTAWRGSDGTVHFRDDIYGRDRTLEAALSARVMKIARTGSEDTATLP